MRLALLMGRRYPPYSKWLGTAFARLPDAPALAPHLAAAIAATSWPARERHLAQAYRAAAGLHNGLGLTPALSTRTRRYYDRPFRVINAGRFTAALLDAIADPQVRELPGVGAVDEFIDSTDALGNTGLLRAAIAAAGGADQARP
jgi:hypothetical protein